MLYAEKARRQAEASRAVINRRLIDEAKLAVDTAALLDRGRCVVEDSSTVRGWAFEEGFEFWLGQSGKLYLRWEI